ncbi:MAG: ABC transporter ATP-binding protein C-terminal domain-containing protein [Eubacteriales bacterium]
MPTSADEIANNQRVTEAYLGGVKSG